MTDSGTSSRDTVPSDERPRFQFSLAWLLIAVTVVAVLLGVGQLLGRTVVAYVGTAMFFAIVDSALPTGFVIAALFAHGEVRVFSIGALVPWIMTRGSITLYYGFQSSWPAWLLMVGSAVVTVVTAALCGFVAVAAHRWIQRHGYGT